MIKMSQSLREKLDSFILTRSHSFSSVIGYSGYFGFGFKPTLNIENCAGNNSMVLKLAKRFPRSVCLDKMWRAWNREKNSELSP